MFFAIFILIVCGLRQLVISFPTNLEHFKNCDFHLIYTEEATDEVEEFLHMNQHSQPWIIETFEKKILTDPHDRRNQKKRIEASKQVCTFKIIIGPETFSELHDTIASFKSTIENSYILIVYFVTLNGWKNMQTGMQQATQEFDTKIVHQNAIAGAFQMSIRAAESEALIPLIGEDTNPSRWESVRKTKIFESEKRQVFVNLHAAYRIYKKCTSSVYKNILLAPSCGTEQIMIEILSQKQNVSHIYTSEFKKGVSLVEPKSYVKSEDTNYKLILTSEVKLHVWYCNRKRTSSSQLLSWVNIGFDKTTWILFCVSYVAITIYLYAYHYWRVKHIQSAKHSFSWLTWIALIFFQDHTPVSRNIILLFVFCAWQLSQCYLCFVQAESLAPFEEPPFENFSQLIDAGYKFYFENHSNIDDKEIYIYLFEKYNLTRRVTDIIHAVNSFQNQTVSIRLDYMDKNKLYGESDCNFYNSMPYNNLECPILPESFYSTEEYWKFSYLYQTASQQSTSRLIEAGIDIFLRNVETRKKYYSLFKESEEFTYKENLPVKMTLFGKVQGAFFYFGFFMFISFITFVLEVLANDVQSKHQTKVEDVAHSKRQRPKKGNTDDDYELDDMRTNFIEVLPCDPAKWTTDNIIQKMSLLKKLKRDWVKLQVISDIFREQEIDGQKLVELTSDSLMALMNGTENDALEMMGIINELKGSQDQQHSPEKEDKIFKKVSNSFTAQTLGKNRFYSFVPWKCDLTSANMRHYSVTNSCSFDNTLQALHVLHKTSSKFRELLDILANTDDKINVGIVKTLELIKKRRYSEAKYVWVSQVLNIEVVDGMSLDGDPFDYGLSQIEFMTQLTQVNYCFNRACENHRVRQYLPRATAFIISPNIAQFVKKVNRLEVSGSCRICRSPNMEHFQIYPDYTPCIVIIHLGYVPLVENFNETIPEEIVMLRKRYQLLCATIYSEERFHYYSVFWEKGRRVIYDGLKEYFTPFSFTQGETLHSVWYYLTE